MNDVLRPPSPHDSRPPLHSYRSPFAFLDRPTVAPVLVDAAAGRVWTQDELAATVKGTADRLLTGQRELVFCLCRADVPSVVGYLSAIRAGHAVALLDATARTDLTEVLVNRYRPRFVTAPSDAPTPEIRELRGAGAPTLADELAVLLSTSGTTGSPKLVRLAYGNIDANASSIAEFLEIDKRERAIQSLPIHYSYGLSVLNSHLAAEASVILTPHSIMRPAFWGHARRWGATSFAGVPHSYTVLDRTGLLRTAMPQTMRTLTQAGGRLAPDSVIQLHRLMSEREGRLWVMYGQTEATARMSYVPPETLPEKADTVGTAIPGGNLRIWVDGQEVVEPDLEGEVIYRGPNVMLGYAHCREDLALDDALHGRLSTGDLGLVDRDGFLRLTGRLKRIAKIHGLRVNLDEIEAAASANGSVVAVDAGDRIVLWRLGGGPVTKDQLRREVARRFGLRSRAFEVRDLAKLPVTASGKIDYETLAEHRAGRGIP